MKVISTTTGIIKNAVRRSICDTLVRIINDYGHNALTYEEYVQTMNDAKHDYFDMISCLEEYELITSEDFEELELHIRLKFNE